jgi:hypothetical protein
VFDAKKTKSFEHSDWISNVIGACTLAGYWFVEQHDSASPSSNFFDMPMKSAPKSSNDRCWVAVKVELEESLPTGPPTYGTSFRHFTSTSSRCSNFKTDSIASISAVVACTQQSDSQNNSTRKPQL